MRSRAQDDHGNARATSAVFSWFNEHGGRPAMTSTDRFARFTPPDFGDLDSLAAALSARCPLAEPVAPLRVLGEGFFSLAVATASGFVFRLGTADGVFERYATETRALPWLARAGLPLALPEPRFLLEPNADLPFGGIGYPLIAGRTLTEADVAGPQRAHVVEQLAAFTHALHALPLEPARALDVPDGRELLRGWYEGDRVLTARALAPLLTASERAAIERFWDRFLAAFDAHVYAPVMTHGDIGDDNLIVDPACGHLVGVIDWEHCALSSPLDDFRNHHDFGRDFLLESLEAYQRLGGRVPKGAAEHLDGCRRQQAFPAIRRAFQRGEMLDAEAIREDLRRHGVLP
jgi:aminoglycoside phosphotransferase (APT) family kinase protein